MSYKNTQISQIKIVDPYSTEKFHEIFNTAIVDICSKMVSEVSVIMGQKAVDSLKETCLSKNIKFCGDIHIKPYKTFEGDGKFMSFMRAIYGFIISLKAYYNLKKGQLLFYNYTNQFALPFILLINRFIKKNVVFIMHGELELLLQSRFEFRLATIYKLTYNFCFSHLFSQSNCLILVLGKSIKKNLISLFPSISKQILFITHPYYLENNQLLNVNKVRFSCLKVGTIGTLNADKGLLDVEYIISSLSNEIADNRIEFIHLGRISESDAMNLKNNVKILNGGRALPIELFNEEIAKLDFVLFCYPQDSYKLTASGAIMDAIVHSKPIISYRNDYFDDVLADENVYWAKSKDEIVAYLSRLIEGNLIVDSINYSSLHKKFSVEENVKILLRQFKRHKVTFLGSAIMKQ